jgi:hypothetical protein
MARGTYYGDISDTGEVDPENHDSKGNRWAVVYDPYSPGVYTIQFVTGFQGFDKLHPTYDLKPHEDPKSGWALHDHTDVDALEFTVRISYNGAPTSHGLTFDAS